MAFHADQREGERLAGVFAEKVTLDYTSLAGGEPAELTPAEIVAAWTSALGGYDATQHLITNHLVDIEGDTAVCTAAFQATHRLATPHGSPLWTLGGTYRFGLVRTAGHGCADQLGGEDYGLGGRQPAPARGGGTHELNRC
ncbi:nuclear transport factor 2 family protein [Streptomyces sp. ISL-99]|uniref:nuclear transport factor 2 family protein n=1 Tax=Streptomyces sp. ISL-99 TaxID=2819193 RepID=UPI0020358F14|nr:nuclear transport factor 2 family protein [Streptomyces sp. ISL-99]